MQTAPHCVRPISRLRQFFGPLAAAILLIATGHAAGAEGVGPLAIAKIGHFFVGGKYVEAKGGQLFAGQSYVEYFIPQNRTHPWPIVMIEGCCPSGAGYMGTPDGRDGWGQYFLSKGYAIYIVDQVGRGRSPYIEPVYGATRSRLPPDVEREMAYEKYNRFPQAKLHTQWPGAGVLGDPVFEQFLAGRFPSIDDAGLRETLNRDATIALLDKIGPSILMPHSQSATPIWLAADARPQLVKGLLMVEAGTSSFHELRLVGAPDWFKEGEMNKPYGLTRAPLTYDPPVKGFADFALVRQEKADGPDLVRCWLQKEPSAKKLINFKNIPVLQMSAEASFGAPNAHCNALFLKSAGVPVDFIKLADIGIRGNGHFLMLEKNNLEIAAVIADWLNKRVTPAETAGAEKK